MIIHFEFEAEDALELARLHSLIAQSMVKIMGEFPIEYSNNARIINLFEQQMIPQLTVEEVRRVKNKLQKDLYGE